MLQNWVNELDSGILNIVENKVHITGFTREEMLQLYLDKGIDVYCHRKSPVMPCFWDT
ncbi:hypothetical protein ABWW58_17155 [Sporolactobacillus sp. STCC-11]|uniref:hypothetical protein n=1 Tax=Sporolactobacillus caesalpiniae TaxID=3230362 RepID=UPI00339194FA